jgi:hypothetical protein
MFTLNSVPVRANSDENPWTSFIIAPNKMNYEKCSDMVHDSIIPLAIIMFRKKDGGISVVAKKRPATGTFFLTTTITGRRN